MSKLLPIMIAATGLSEWDIRSIIVNAPSRYKHFRISKRSGGQRIISQPAREVKALQRVLIECCLSKLPVHEAAMAYRPGRSILENATAHSNCGPIKKYDFSDFFHSIRSADWKKFCDHNNVFDNVFDYEISERLIFQRDKGSRILKLSIGAPSSPIVSNILMYKFDEMVWEYVLGKSIVYTRYADDLTFSAPRTGYLTVVDRALREIIRSVSWPRLRINESKTILATQKVRRQVTGLIITNDGEISIGRDRKRDIRASLHHVSIGKLSPKELSYLSGLLSFAHSIEPDFVRRMEGRYGVELIDYVKRHGSLTRRALSTNPNDLRGPDPIQPI